MFVHCCLYLFSISRHLTFEIVFKFHPCVFLTLMFIISLTLIQLIATCFIWSGLDVSFFCSVWPRIVLSSVSFRDLATVQSIFPHFCGPVSRILLYYSLMVLSSRLCYNHLQVSSFPCLVYYDPSCSCFGQCSLLNIVHFLFPVWKVSVYILSDLLSYFVLVHLVTRKPVRNHVGEYHSFPTFIPSFSFNMMKLCDSTVLNYRFFIMFQPPFIVFLAGVVQIYFFVSFHLLLVWVYRSWSSSVYIYKYNNFFLSTITLYTKN